MGVNVNNLCADAESLIGKATYTMGNESECADYNKLLTGAYTTMCAGFIVAICKHNGLSVYNGSNTLFRKYLTQYGSVSDHKSSNGYSKKNNPLKSTQLEKGMLVFKWSATGQPSKYTKDGLGNYQHVGIVTSVNPLRIVHSTSVDHEGIRVDKSIGNFCAWGKLKGVDYGSANIADTTPVSSDSEYIIDQGVDTMTGGKLQTVANMRIRAGKSVTSKVLATVPMGTQLDFTGDFNSGWVGVTYNGVSGFMCVNKSTYAVLVSAKETEQTTETANEDILTRIKALEGRIEALELMMQG